MSSNENEQYGRKKGSRIKLTSYDELFGSSSESGQQIVEMRLEELKSFENHPFQIKDDEKMQETVESISERGVLVPAIVRPRKEGGYEMLSGHRRKRGSELAGKETMPVLIRECDDREAIAIMVDSNIQRETVLPSEKARAYRMKYETIRHQGNRSGSVGLDQMREQTGESTKTIQRFIWLSRLSDELLEMVDQKKLGFSQGVDISFLKMEEQSWVYQAIRQKQVTVTTEQSAKLKELSRKEQLTEQIVQLMIMEKKKEKRKVVIRNDRLKKYFSAEYTDEQIQMIIFELLDKWKEGEGQT